MPGTETQTAEQFAASQADLYGTYTANKHIRINGALAFTAGDPVPVTHVGRVVHVDDVDLVDGKTAPGRQVHQHEGS